MAGNGGEEELLNIKQAAALLNVSEVSLRRWTNAGILPCVRVGKRRERRFRRPELEAYLAGTRNMPGAAAGDASAAAKAAALPDAAPAVSIDGMTLPAGSHLCVIYKSEPGRLRLAARFLRDGLAAGEACVLAGDSAGEGRLWQALVGSGADVDALSRDKRLILLDDTLSSAAELCDRLERCFIEALGRGARVVRVVADMAWALDAGLSEAALLEFERRYDHEVAPRYPAVSLCLYDARRFSGLGVVGALQAHPHDFRHDLSRLIG